MPFFVMQFPLVHCIETRLFGTLGANDRFYGQMNRIYVIEIALEGGKIGSAAFAPFRRALRWC